MEGRTGPTQTVKQSRRGNFKRPREEFQEWQTHRRYLHVLTPRLERTGAWTLSRYDVTESPGPLLLTVWGHAPTGQLPSNFASLFPLCLLSLSFRPLSHVAMPPPMLCRPVFSAGIRKAPCSLNKSFFTPTHHLGLRLNRGPAQRPFAQFARANRALGHPYRPPSRYAPVLLREVAGWYLKVAASGFGLALVFLAAPVMYCDCMRRFLAVAYRAGQLTPAMRGLPSAPPSKTPTPIAPTSQSVDSQTPDISAPLPPPPQSIVNLYELTFGTVCGVCAGVFVKKGARAVAFALGGVFVLLQVSDMPHVHLTRMTDGVPMMTTVLGLPVTRARGLGSRGEPV